MTNHLELMQFILNNFSSYAKSNMNYVPISKILDLLKETITNYNEEQIKQYLIRLRILNYIELKLTKSLLAKNLNIDLVNINGINYGLLKILEFY